MSVKRYDSLINNAAAILSMLPATPSGKALLDAPLYLGGKKDIRAACRTGSDSDKIFFRMLHVLSRPFDEFDANALLKLHGFIFDGIRPDAGKLRTSSAELNGSSFADASLIAGSMKRLLGKLADTPAAPDVSREDFAMSMTYFFGEIFLLCPFRSTSTFIEALFFALFAPSRGFRFDYSRTGGARLFEAAKKAFVTDESGDLFVCLNESIVYMGVESEGKEIPVVDAEQVKRELKVKGKPKTLVKRGATPRPDKPKKDEKPKKTERKGRSEKKDRPPKKEASEKRKPEPVKKLKPEPVKKDASKAVKKVSVEAEMSAARAAIEAEMLAAKAVIAAEAEAARAAIEAEKAAARAEMEAKANQAPPEKKTTTKKSTAKSNGDKSSRVKNNLKKALARTVLLFEDIPEFAADDDKFAPAPPEKENRLLLPSSESTAENSEPPSPALASDAATTEKSEPAILPKLAPIKKIERAESEDAAPSNANEQATNTRENRETVSETTAENAESKLENNIAALESDEDKLARHIADMSKLPSSVLKKAARIKEKIELLQKELKDVLNTTETQTPKGK